MIVEFERGCGASETVKGKGKESLVCIALYYELLISKARRLTRDHTG